MIKIIDKEYREGDLGVRTITVTLFGLTVFSKKKTTTNNKAVTMLTSLSRPSKKVSGFV